MASNKAQTQLSSGLLDALTPQALRFYPNYIQYGDMVARVIIVTAFPTQAGPAWVARATQIPYVVSSIHLTPTQSNELVDTFSRAIGLYEGRMEEGGKAVTMQRISKELEHAKIMLEKIDQEQQNLFYLTCLFMVIAPDMDTLDRNTKRLENTLSASGMRGRTLIHRQEMGLKSIGPWGYLEPELLTAGGRNMLSETAAAAFPFVASGINDGSGIAIGKDAEGGIVIIDIWEKGGDRRNSNGIILGVSGAGKTFTGKEICFRQFIQGSKVIVIDPEREFKPICKMLGGNWINVAGGRGRINPLQIRIIPPDPDEIEEDEEEIFITAENPMDLHLQLLRHFFTLYIPSLDDIKRALLEDLIIELYKEFEITFETDPATVPLDKWPIMHDLYIKALNKFDEYSQKQNQIMAARWEEISILLKSAAVGADANMFNGHSTVTTDTDFIVLDINAIQKAAPNLRAAQYYNVLTYIWNIIAQDRQERIMLYVAEAWMLVDEDCPQTLQFMRDTSKRIRKYEGSFWVDSQQVIDFTAPKVAQHGEAILSNPTYKILLGQGDKDLEALTKLMNLTDTEQLLLSKAVRGKGILVAGSQRIQVNIEAAPYEEPYLVGGGN